MDSSDPDRFEESKKELHDLFETIKGSEVMLIVLGNKIDIAKRAVGIDTLKQSLAYDEETIRSNYQIDTALFMCSVAKQVGYMDAF